VAVAREEEMNCEEERSELDVQHDSGLVEAVGMWKYDNEHTYCYNNQDVT